MNNTQGLQSLLLPLSIRNTLKRHRLNVADVFSLEKVASVLTDRTICDLIVVQQSIYRLLPNNPDEHRFTGERPGRQLPKDHLNWQSDAESDECEGCSPMCSGFGFIDLEYHYQNQSVSTALKERFQKSIKPLLQLYRAQSEYALFAERMFREKPETGCGGRVAIGNPDDWLTDRAFDIQLTDGNQMVIIYDERLFPNATHFQQLVSDLLNMGFKLSNYEETVRQMGDLFTYYLNRLELKSR